LISKVISTLATLFYYFYIGVSSLSTYGSLISKVISIIATLFYYFHTGVSSLSTYGSPCVLCLHALEFWSGCVTCFDC
jgi:hypothetical protein